MFHLVANNWAKETTAAATKPALTPTMPTPSSFTTQPVHEEQHPDVWATVVFDFVASSPFEISANGKNSVSHSSIEVDY
jgi:hypothetical protein